MSELTVTAFLDSVAGESAAPGGGAVAALAAALSAALGVMVARLTLGRPQYAESRDRVQELAAMLDDQRSALTEAVSADAAAYRALMATYRLPKVGQAERAMRRNRIEDAMTQVGEIPLGVARRSLQVLQLLSELVEIGNIDAIGDAGSGVFLGAAAARASVLNVRINAQGLLRQDLAARWRDEAGFVETRVAAVEQTVIQRLTRRIGLEQSGHA